MSSKLDSKRPTPDAYDHLWPLLPVFAVFLALILFVAAGPDHLPQDSRAAEPVPMAPASVAQSRQRAADSSVPSAVGAMAALTELPAQAIATF